MRQMDVWLRWSASVSPASASWSAASATDGKESSVGNRGNVCFLLTTTYHGCSSLYVFGFGLVGMWESPGDCFKTFGMRLLNCCRHPSSQPIRIGP